MNRIAIAALLLLAAFAPVRAGEVPRAYAHPATLSGRLPANVVLHVHASYAARMWTPAVSVASALPIPIPHRKHPTQTRAFVARAEADGRYHVSFPMYVEGKLGLNYYLDATSLTVEVPGKPGENLPTWLVPSFRPSVDLGRANISLDDVATLHLKNRTTAGPVTTEIHTTNGQSFVGHIVAFPAAEGENTATLDFE